MASRFFHKFSSGSGMSGSTSLVGAHASAARAGAAPAARYFNVFPCSHADAKTSLTTTGITSTIKNGMKPAFHDFARGVKRTFSSSASISNNQNSAIGAKIAAWKAQYAASKPKLSVAEAVKKDMDTTKILMVFTSLCVLYMSAVDNTSRNIDSSHCLNCCNCPCHGSNPKVQ